MPRQFPYTFERIEGQSPTPCSVCDNMGAAFWIAVKLGDSLATSVCDECAADVVAATGPIATAANIYACAECNRSFGTPAALGSHRRTHKALVA